MRVDSYVRRRGKRQSAVQFSLRCNIAKKRRVVGERKFVLASKSVTVSVVDCLARRVSCTGVRLFRYDFSLRNVLRARMCDSEFFRGHRFFYSGSLCITKFVG